MARDALLIFVALLAVSGMDVASQEAAAQTPREEKQVEETESQERPAYKPRSSRTNQQQERQDRARPAPVRERKKSGESQQDYRKRRNKERGLGQ